MSKLLSNNVEQEILAAMPALRAFSFRFVRSSTDVDDLVQEAVLRGLRNIDSFTPGTSMKSWLFTIIRNLYCTGYRRSVREGCGRTDDAATFVTPVLSGQEWTMRAIDVNTALLHLPAGERHALLLVANGMSYIDAAAACGCKVGTIKRRVSRGRLHLAALLGEKTIVEAVSIN